MADKKEEEQVVETNEVLEEDQTVTPDADEETTEDEVLVVSLDGDSPPETDDNGDEDNTTLKQLREAARKHRQDAIQARRELAARDARDAGATIPELPDMPTLASCDFDEEEFPQKMAEWVALKAQHDSALQEAEQSEKSRQDAYNTKIEAFKAARSSIVQENKISDYDEMVEVAEDGLSEIQRGMIVHGARKPELLLYAVAKNPKLLERISGIKDNVEFAFELGRLEVGLKTTQRKPSVAPESRVEGGGPAGTSDQAKLDRLLTAWQKSQSSTDRQAYRDFKRSMKAA